MNDAGKIVITPKGEYSATTAYEWYDSVTKDGIAYVALKNTSGVTPGTDAATWQKWIDFNPPIEAAADTAATKATEMAKNSAKEAAASAEEAKKYADSAGATENLYALHGIYGYSASGSNLSLSPTSDFPISKLKVYGKSEQVQTTGKNLLDASKVSGSAYSFNSISYELTVSALDERMWEDVSSIANLPSGSYCISRDNPKGEIQLNFGDAGFFIMPRDSLKYNFTINSNASMKIKVALGSSFPQTYKIMLNVGSTPLPYEPYTGGSPSPSPDYPQEIDVPGLVCGGRQILDLENWIDGQYKIICRCSIGDTFTLSLKGTTSNSSGNAVIIDTITNNDVFAQFTDRVLARADGNSYSVTLTSTINGYVRAYMAYGRQFYDFDYIMLNAGSIPLPYEPYPSEENIRKFNVIGVEASKEGNAESTATLRTPNGLPGIPVPDDYADYTYMDEDLQKWVADTIEYEGDRAKYVKRIGHYNANGSVPANASWNTGSGILYGFVLNEGEASLSYPIISDKLMNVGESLWNSDISGFYFPDKEPGRVRIKIATATIGDQDILTYLTKNSIQFYYVLKTPFTTYIDTETTDSLRRFHTLEKATTITNTGDCHMDVDYTIDNRTDVEKRLYVKDDETGDRYRIGVDSGMMYIEY